MALPLKKAKFSVSTTQYRWTKRSTDRFTEVCIELNEKPDGQMIIAQCPRIFRPDMVETIVEEGRKMGWKPETTDKEITVRLTKRGLIPMD